MSGDVAGSSPRRARGYSNTEDMPRAEVKIRMDDINAAEKLNPGNDKSFVNHLVRAFTYM